MIINHNLSAMNAHRQMGINNGDKSKSIEKLSSGMRINRAGDDAAGLSISEKMRGQIRGLNQASRNSQDGISLIQTAEGALSETQSIIQRMRELSVQAANGTNQNEDRDKIAKEFEELQAEITRIGNDTEFNKMKLINGDLSSEVSTTAQDLGMFNNYSMGELTEIKSNLTSTVGKLTVSAQKLGASVATKQANAAAKTDKIRSINENVVSALSAKIIELNKNSVVRLNAAVSALDKKLEDIASTDFEAIKRNRDSVKQLRSKLGQAASKINSVRNSMNANDAKIDSLRASVTAYTSKSINATQSKYNDKLNSANVAQASLDTMKNVISIKRAGDTLPNGKSQGAEVKFQVGANSGQVIALEIGDMRATALGVNKEAININTQSAASNAITVLDKALTTISDQRAKLGAAQNRLEHTITSTDNTSENLQAAESRIRDVDMANEMMNYTKSNILTSAAQSMLAQANQAPNNVLQLLQ